jgi:hypothetical protein
MACIETAGSFGGFGGLMLRLVVDALVFGRVLLRAGGLVVAFFRLVPCGLFCIP